jgi:hypothetical protein
MTRWWFHSGQFLFAALVSAAFIVAALFLEAYALVLAGAAFGAAAYGVWRLDRRFRGSA